MRRRVASCNLADSVVDPTNLTGTITLPYSIKKCKCKLTYIYFLEMLKKGQY